MPAILLLAVGLAAAAAQDLPPGAAVSAGAERVSVDVVVRDKKGRFIRDLTAAEVEVYEDGVRQQIDAFRLVVRHPRPAALEAPRTATSPPAGAAASVAEPRVEEEPAVVALVFDRLGQRARADACRAAAGYAARARDAGRRVGIFSLDPELRILAPFTDEPERLRAALDRAGTLAPRSGSTAGTRQRLRDLADWRSELADSAQGIGQAHVASAESAGNTVRGQAGLLSQRDSAREQVVAQVMTRMLTTFESLDREQEGRSTAASLLALVSSLEALAGRKAVVLFSEGLTLPAGVESAFLSVISAANRANVAIYAMDAAGLRVASTAAETSRETESLRTREREGAWIRGLEQNEDALRLSPEAGLGRLAGETGGRLLQNANDLGAGLAAVDADLGEYYLISYAPRNELYDGRFREITVEVKRPHGRLQARRGYLAVRQALPVPAFEYEGPALAHLDGGPLPTTVPLRIRGFQFPDEPPLSTVSLVVEVPSAEFEVRPDPKGKSWSQDFSIVALVRDASGRVVAKLSQRYARSRADDEEARHGLIHFYREVRLPPGSYSVESVALDAYSGAAGGAKVPLDVHAAAEGFMRASSLVVVRSAEPLPEEEKRAPRALHCDGTLVFPNLGETVSQGSGKPLPFVLTAWLAAGLRPREATVDVVRGPGPPLSRASLPLPEPDASGRIQIMGGLPLEGLDPGPYVLRVSLDDGRERLTRAAPFVLVR